MIEISKINPEKIRKRAEDYYRKLEYYCTEAIVKSFIDELELSLPDDVIAMSSGFPLGLGQAGCSCGAVTGGVMMLGYFFGRKKPKDTKVFHAMKLAKELHEDEVRKKFLKYGRRKLHKLEDAEDFSSFAYEQWLSKGRKNCRWLLCDF